MNTESLIPPSEVDAALSTTQEQPQQPKKSPSALSLTDFLTGNFDEAPPTFTDYRWAVSFKQPILAMNSNRFPGVETLVDGWVNYVFRPLSDPTKDKTDWSKDAYPASKDVPDDMPSIREKIKKAILAGTHIKKVEDAPIADQKKASEYLHSYAHHTWNPDFYEQSEEEDGTADSLTSRQQLDHLVKAACYDLRDINTLLYWLVAGVQTWSSNNGAAPEELIPVLGTVMRSRFSEVNVMSGPLAESIYAAVTEANEAGGTLEHDTSLGMMLLQEIRFLMEQLMQIVNHELFEEVHAVPVLDTVDGSGVKDLDIFDSLTIPVFNRASLLCHVANLRSTCALDYDFFLGATFSQTILDSIQAELTDGVQTDNSVMPQSSKSHLFRSRRITRAISERRAWDLLSAIHKHGSKDVTEEEEADHLLGYADLVSEWCNWDNWKEDMDKYVRINNHIADRLENVVEDLPMSPTANTPGLLPLSAFLARRVKSLRGEVYDEEMLRSSRLSGVNASPFVSVLGNKKGGVISLNGRYLPASYGINSSKMLQHLRGRKDYSDTAGSLSSNRDAPTPVENISNTGHSYSTMSNYERGDHNSHSFASFPLELISASDSVAAMDAHSQEMTVCSFDYPKIWEELKREFDGSKTQAYLVFQFLFSRKYATASGCNLAFPFWWNRMEGKGDAHKTEVSELCKNRYMVYGSKTPGNACKLSGGYASPYTTFTSPAHWPAHHLQLRDEGVVVYESNEWITCSDTFDTFMSGRIPYLAYTDNEPRGNLGPDMHSQLGGACHSLFAYMMFDSYRFFSLI